MLYLFPLGQKKSPAGVFHICMLNYHNGKNIPKISIVNTMLLLNP